MHNVPFAPPLINATYSLLMELGLRGDILSFTEKWFVTAGVVVPENTFLDSSMFPYEATISGLKARPELNGQRATVVRFMEQGKSAGRLAVRIDGEMLLLKSENVLQRP